MAKAACGAARLNGHRRDSGVETSAIMIPIPVLIRFQRWYNLELKEDLLEKLGDRVEADCYDAVVGTTSVYAQLNRNTT